MDRPGRCNQGKERILKTRVKRTSLLSEYFSKVNYLPKVVVSGSAIGFYGIHEGEYLFEESTKGTKFLSGVC